MRPKKEVQEPVWDSPLKKEEVEPFVRFLREANRDVLIESLTLSVRSSNCLKRAKCFLLSDCFKYYPNDFLKLSNMGVKSEQELKDKINSKITELYPTFQRYLAGDPIEDMVADAAQVAPVKDSAANDGSDSDAVRPQSTDALLDDVATKEKLIVFYSTKKIVPITELQLSARAYNCLKHAFVSDLAGVLDRYPNRLLTIRNMGVTSYAEVKDAILKMLLKDKAAIYAYLGGSTKDVYTEDEVQGMVLRCFTGKGFAGLSFKDIRAELPTVMDDAQIKRAIGKMLQAKVLEYIDYRCYRVYPSFEEALEKYGPQLQDREYPVLQMSVTKHTLQEIGAEYGISRERVRQILAKAHKRLKKLYTDDTGLDIFDEDYYRQLDETYDVPEECWLAYLGLTMQQLRYLISSRTAKTKDKKPLSEVLADTDIDLGTRLKINDYLNRNSLYIDGDYVDSSRAALIPYYAQKYCTDQTSIKNFYPHFNQWLLDNGIAADSSLLFDSEHNAEAQLMRTDNIVWSNRKTIRYYDFAGRDFTDLFDGLSLDSYHNVEITTEKLFHSQPELMAEYDIRDRYELHNILRTLKADEMYPELKFGKMPTIDFGTFDRDAAIMELIRELAPITREELVDYLYDEYGYDKNSLILSYLPPFEKYCHNNIYAVDHNAIVPEAQKELAACLTDSFYFIDEIKQKYLELRPTASADDINPWSLKLMGFQSHVTYAIKGFDTAEEYFISLLLKDEVFNITPYKKRYGTISMFGVAINELKKNSEIFEYAPNRFISIKRLAKFDIDKSDIKDTCYAAMEAVDNNSFFTVHSLFNAGFQSDLSKYGFDEFFFTSLFAASGLFPMKKIFGTTIFYNGELTDTDDIIPAFLLEAFNEYEAESVYLDDLIDDCCTTYGFSSMMKSSVIDELTHAGLYYNKYTLKVYRNKKIYLSEHER